ncbi:MAG: ADP-ribosylglycohydrolase family protein [bacterium]|nr:ADP-ribosylglycohydrolase family protein [bacterium]
MNQMPDTTKIEESPGSFYLHDEAIDRAVGAVVGSAVGDALGAFYETAYPRFDEEITMRPGGGFDHRRALGGWTDDTSMALGILDALAAGHAEAVAELAEAVARHREAGRGDEGHGDEGRDDEGRDDEGRGVPDRPDWHWDPPPIRLPAMAANFLRWYRGGPPDVGIQTSQILGSAASPEDVAEAARRFAEANPDSAGNGALMRTAPVALAGYLSDHVAPLAAEVAELTHPHPDSVDACVLWSVAVNQAIHDRLRWLTLPGDLGGTDDGPEGTVDFRKAVRSGLEFLPEARRDRWSGLIDAAVAVSDPAEARRLFTPNGWVVTAFQAALWAISATPVRSPSQHFRDALVAAVRLGHDTDTVAAIAGGLLGARWGLAAIPTEWTRCLHGDRVRGETVTGAELAAIALAAFDCTMRRWFSLRAEHWNTPMAMTKVTAENVDELTRRAKVWEKYRRQVEETGDTDSEILYEAGIFKRPDDE